MKEVINMEWKYTHKGFWIGEKAGKYYMVSYNYAPLTKRKRTIEIKEEEYEKYAKCVIN